ncbi:MAG TPA: CRISPR-associated endonuclease Cas2 [Aminobacterium sp.]|jgi:CRISPR-associated protein Cas2|uniref:CRISPR-associated endonuclease Cas2 n=1 Tax=Aminobacterium TaxID=81466 RepID=UPI000ECC943D|nr:CRISPR-associated endonuclease Cas2 [Aminobacterium sp. UBA4834]HCA41116.1 CRISPR-associated endonuclease Cas2 [Aminobacterium sp.]
MWVIAMFDLPVGTRENKKSYSTFRKKLLNEGFMMLQFSVYARFCSNSDSASTYRSRIQKVLPPNGQVRLIYLTDHQFGRMEVYNGKKRTAPEGRPKQIMLF